MQAVQALGKHTSFPSITPRNTSISVNRGQLTRHRQLLAQWSRFMNDIWITRTPALGDPAGAETQ